ncbi:MAG: 30S ribosomal protein S3 [Candidatus Lloydbacteria bacterium RIFCSPHIGHO2_02_FULL_51_22]|uniref:Small ribosomal subunit protein uS3 n=3 Tax=Candidatus Lloydiibacteriota TaxID=1817910 RepID=A0A1G2DBB8_9BACT|nr:MAG: 30S ribosomal protein S3 [Candidatus Lloydbacteria bacterium RIFCSPHIGHO2_02_FULL_51_22]OGZ15791.1 MAG: 30S ribosomal protein S3 [Candidatus Lloydbacteria bacterium RIFCSPLOWO2_02_FULL_51_11]OGZ16978.1 MAG: 30S ribosomal protein S3 [Candidatus Lloydbacteria bacterium RIFCSPLOWO2_12_FULL_51_9]
MTHVVHPYAHRLGIIRDWKSRWFGVGKQYQKFLKEDITIREYLDKRLLGLYVASLDIERSNRKLRLIIRTARPGMLIGRQGEGAARFKEDVKKVMKKHGIPSDGLVIDIEEVRFPEANAMIVAQMVVEGLSRRLPFRRVLKQTIEKVMSTRDVKGARIMISGRLGGAEMSRTEQIKKGMLPLQTLRADVDFARATARLSYGAIGVKVWIYRGIIFADKNAQVH